MPLRDSRGPTSDNHDQSPSRPDVNNLDRDQLRIELTRARDRYRRLISRRSVRLALSLSKFVAPLLGKRNSSVPSTTDAAASTRHIRRIYESFDETLDQNTRADLHRYYVDSPFLADRSVSVIMPTYNRESQLLRAARSVIDQTHQAFELIIVDDGSTDDTASILVDLLEDPRVSVLRLERGGVSRARNEGLRRANGDFIAYLDSDNRWDGQYLELMLAGMDQSGSDIGYSAMKLEQHGRVVGYRGDEFDYEECLRDNYVDLNVLCHRRELSDVTPRFDESLRRLNDWDYLLRIARARSVSYFPFIGAEYSWEESSDQLTLSEPALYRHIVQHRFGDGQRDQHEQDSVTIFRKLSLRICIRTSAPRGERQSWGDFHFARGLGQAFERFGHDVVLSFREDPEPEQQDVVISLRGLVRYEPVPRCVNVLWNISHPDLVDFDEIEQFDLYFAASMTWATAVSWVVERSCHTMLQATDRAAFFPRATRTALDSDVVFVGNSRGTDRWLVTAAINVGLDLAIFGGGWEGTPAERFVRAEYLPHQELGEIYAGTAVVLNDHWASMKDFGFVSNRVFDVTASGGRLISDHVTSISATFGDTVTTVRTADEVVGALHTARSLDRDQVQRTATWVVENHSFDNRAESLLEHIEEFLLSNSAHARHQASHGPPCQLCTPRPSRQDGGPRRVGTPPRAAFSPSSPGRQLRVGILAPPDGIELPDSVYSRLIQPLTTEIDGVSVAVVPVVIDQASKDSVDALIVHGSTIWGGDPAIARVEEIARDGTVIVLDTGHGTDLSRLALAAHDNAAASRLRTLSALSREVWTPSASAAGTLVLDDTADIVTVPSGLDRRLWTTYRHRRTASAEEPGQLRLLHAARNWSRIDDTACIEMIGDAAADLDFELILVASSQPISEAPWIRHVSVPDGLTYPRHARLLRSVANGADIGIVVADDRSDESEQWRNHVDECLALGIVPMVLDHGGRLLPGDWYPSSVPSSTNPRSFLHSFVEDRAFRAGVLEESAAARDEMWELRGAAVVGRDLVARLIRLTDRFSSPSTRG